MSTPHSHIFISHASADDAFVKQLREQLEANHLKVWVDSRNLRGGDQLRPEIEAAIRVARHVLVVISPETINSDWVFAEIKLAEQVAKERADFRIIPLMLPNITPKALKRYFSEEPAGERIELGVGKLEEAMPRILAALGERLPDEMNVAQAIQFKPLVELRLELSEPTIQALDNHTEQVSARAKLIFDAGNPVERPIETTTFKFTLPIPAKGLQGLEELSWYLEHYHEWAVGVFRTRAEKLEELLPQWGKALYQATLGKEYCHEVLQSWNQHKHADRRFSVQISAEVMEGESLAAQEQARIAASRLQAVPWELLHDDEGYLAEGKYPIRVRRRLPNYKQHEALQLSLPIRILLVTSRPEQKGVSYLDHRASALPLVNAVENLGSLVQLTLLSPATVEALEQELQRASRANEPYHVLHFDGHGVYDAHYGLGALCFEKAEDAKQLEQRRMDLVHADKLAALLRDYRIPLVVLEACQSAQSDKNPTDSVAASLLQQGISSVVAMTHSVLVVTAQQFVEPFYQSLAQGERVASAMLQGQSSLMRNTFRFSQQSVGDVHLKDWFVPILYQEHYDPALFQTLPSEMAQRVNTHRRALQFGFLPETPSHTFIGRSRELLQVERLLEQQPYAVLRGQGGIGKTTLAVELARWLVRSGRVDRAAFISVEDGYNRHVRAVVDVLGKQLVGDYYAVAEYKDLKQALQPIQRELENQRVLIVVDNVESLLADEANLAEVLELLWGLLLPLPPSPALPPKWGKGAKMLFTSREALPEPFVVRPITLGALSVRDAKALVLQVMNTEGLQLRHDERGHEPEQVRALVEAVGCHARALVLLARELARSGLSATTEHTQQIMHDLHQRFPDQRELSLFASVELSLQRLSPEMRERVQGLAVFEGGGILYTVSEVACAGEVEPAKQLLAELIEVGLAEEQAYSYVRFDPALAPYLKLSLSEEQWQSYQQRWVEVMGELVDYLYQQRFQDTQLAQQLGLLELPNLMRYLQQQVQAWQQEPVSGDLVLDKLGRVEQLLASLNQPQALQTVVQWRHSIAQTMTDWSHARFEHERMSIERLFQQGDLQQASHQAQQLLAQCQQAGMHAYTDADYDGAIAQFLLGRILEMGGESAQALPYLQAAQQGFEALGESGAGMASKCLTEQGDCLLGLGQWDQATEAYEKSIMLDEELKDLRGVAVGKIQLATVRMQQQRYEEALAGYHEALDLFNQLNEPSSVAVAWHQIAMVYRRQQHYAPAEHAYKQSLAINSQQGNRAGEARTLSELGNLYDDWERLEQALTWYQQAVELYVALRDLRSEGLARNNLANTLIRLERYEEARIELQRAIECDKAFGHVAEPWKTWACLYNLETACGNTQAAQAARQQAIQSYLAYRREGGQTNILSAQLAQATLQAIQAKQTDVILQELHEREAQTQQRYLKIFIPKLREIISGSRDKSLAEDEALDYDDAVELLLLLEQLETLGL
ncbi:MAG: tetratricopeptide repeat protein [Thiofilum sp.]|uniref:tetratricopeptide repeat protein n=1 Tax=Thiofilum sp. TaxID=2212733 RepID=UPI0025E88586|nr:tetratricopeptide repeat protein [Thiofilum sp.]MBK8455394.1 CHAT domain-containing protein [Thiofilum sp.]